VDEDREQLMMSTTALPEIARVDGHPQAQARIVSSSNETQDRVTLSAAYRRVAEYLYRDLGRFAYEAWDHINSTYFGGRLPETFILWDLTNYGHCLGWCRSHDDGPPIIKLHPAVITPAAESPWGIPAEHLGHVFAYDILLHECIHSSVEYLLGGWERMPGRKSYWTSHNNPLWMTEVNRIAPLLGYHGDEFTMKRSRRIEIAGQKTKSGKAATRTARRQAGHAPDFERFPHSLPGSEPLYARKLLPFEWQPRVLQLQNTVTVEARATEGQGFRAARATLQGAPSSIGGCARQCHGKLKPGRVTGENLPPPNPLNSPGSRSAQSPAKRRRLPADCRHPRLQESRFII
jgi:hypothetical protein